MSSTMTASRRKRATTAIAMAAMAAMAMLAPAPAGAAKPGTTAITLGATHVLGTSALLTAAIDPAGQPTSYYFLYGTTTAFGFQVGPISIGAGTARIRVGQTVAHLIPGETYHFRVLAVPSADPPQQFGPTIVCALPSPVICGRESKFKTKGIPPVLALEKTPTQTYGSPFVVSGSLTGTGNANQPVALQASPFPYLEAFSSIGIPAMTNSSGRFSFRVANLSVDTQFRASTLTPLPIFSPIITVPVSPRIVLHVHSSGVPGLVRLYGTIAPAANGARVELQVQKAVRPGKSEATERWVTQFTAKASKAGAKSSRFSMVVKIRHGGRYRAYVSLQRGRLSPGASLNTIIIHA